MRNNVVKLSDIAKKLNISVNTVSRALNDGADISKKTKEIVKQTASEMGYVPNYIAASLRSGKTKTIAIVFDNMVNPYFMIMSNKLYAKSRNLGYDTLIFNCKPGFFTLESLKIIIARHVDAIITFLEPTEDVIDFCKKTQMPIILVGRRINDERINMVVSSDFYGGSLAAQELIDCKNVCYIGASKNVECCIRRLDGFRSTINKDISVFYQEVMSSSEMIDEIISKKIDGVFCFNDIIAIEIIKDLTLRNVMIPEEIKIVGYDNISRYFPVIIDLTSVDINIEEVSTKTIELLFEEMNHPLEKTVCLEIPTTIYKGKTTRNPE